MSKAEPDVYRVVGRALRASVPHLEVEMLVADSSRGHFRQTLTTAGDGPEARQRLRCGLAAGLPGDDPGPQPRLFE